jgi:ABC-2 type transport system ATP-binding protein
MLQVSGVCAGYRAGDILKDTHLQIEAGEWVALVGPNGSGKTTLLRCIVGALPLSRGDIRIAGHVLSESVEAKRRLGYACAPDQLPELLTGKQCLEVYAAAKGLRHIESEVLSLAADLRLLDHLGAFVETYSLGMRQKLAVLLALLGDPDLIVLDEIFNGLDPASALHMKRYLRRRVQERRSSVLLATHSLDIVDRYCDRAVLLIGGRIIRQWSEVELRNIGGSENLEVALASAAEAEG